MEYIDMPIVIFGASGGAIKVAQTLENINVKFEFFVDNDSNKWGKELEGKQIVSPELLKEKEYAIVIASDYQEEIEEQLERMGMISNLVLKEQFIMEYIKVHMDEFDNLKNVEINVVKHENIIIDLVEGIGLGGIETWSFMIAEELLQRDRDVLIFSKITEDKPPKKLEGIVQQFDLDYRKYFSSIKILVDALVTMLPCTILTNWQSQVLIAGAIVKELFQDKIKIVSVLHNDKIAIYRRQQYLDCYTDDIICVSEKIKRQMNEKYSIIENKLHYKESSVEYEEDYIKTYTVESDKPIQIGFAARIDKFQKRADLLVKLIKELEKEHILYQMNIAGIGNYLDKLNSFIEENNLEDHVKLHGLIARSYMADFWKENDIFLSVSDFEGASISMLEAMSYGVVPVVTEVSGVNEFVANGVNGIVRAVGDITGIKRGIIFLRENQALLEQYGKICRETISKKCNKKEYIEYVLDLASKERY